MTNTFLRCAAVITSCLVVAVSAFGKTAACPCGNCPCAPCTCGGGGPKKPSEGGKNKSGDSGKTASNHHDAHQGEHRGHDKGGHGGSSVGVGVTVDLGGVGQRKPEADPFASGGPPVSHTSAKLDEPKPKTKNHQTGRSTDPFADVELTGQEAKTDTKTVSR